MSLSSKELQTRIIFATLAPAAKLAMRFRTSLREMKHLVELSLYQEARSKKLKMKDIRAALGISMSKVGLLSKDLKTHFAGPDQLHGLPRRILSLLWAGPLSEARLVAVLEAQDDPDAIRQTLATMLQDKRLKMTDERTPRYSLGEPRYRLVQEPWMARVDALQDLMQVVSRTVEARFFDGDERAQARTLNFRIRPEDLPKLRKLYEEEIFPLVCQLDEAVDPDAPSLPLSLSVLWTPQEEARDTTAQDKKP